MSTCYSEHPEHWVMHEIACQMVSAEHDAKIVEDILGGKSAEQVAERVADRFLYPDASDLWIRQIRAWARQDVGRAQRWLTVSGWADDETVRVVQDSLRSW